MDLDDMNDEGEPINARGEWRTFWLRRYKALRKELDELQLEPLPSEEVVEAMTPDQAAAFVEQELQRGHRVIELINEMESAGEEFRRSMLEDGDPIGPTDS